MSGKLVLVLPLAALIAVVALAFPVAGPSAAPQELAGADVKIIQDFQARVQAVLDLRKKLERDMPKLPDSATPQQVDAHQRAIEKALRTARAGAKRGDLFTPLI
jgi:hypothetical protein